MSDPTARRYSKGPRAVAGLVAKVTAPALKARGLANAQVVTDWPAIVGPELSRKSFPEKLSFPARQRTGGTLRVRVEPVFATEFQHLESEIVDRLNTYYGFNAVARLHLRQAPVGGPVPTPAAAPPEAGPAGRAAVEALVAPLADGDLKSALMRLGIRVFGRAEARGAGRREPDRDGPDGSGS
ncbi:MAG: DciA family protein [Alphaproteobacteria bacterium]